jgi:gliotoxin/aspirochlorine biosynthesis aminotransferase
MDSGLSTRMTRALPELRPQSSAIKPHRNNNAAPPIDLSTAQNEVIRAELQEFLTTTIEDKLSSEVWSLLIFGRHR